MSTTSGLAQTGGASEPVLSPNGRYVAYFMFATDVVTPDANGTVADVIIRAVPVPTITSVTPATVARGATANITVNGAYLLQSVSWLFGDGITVTNANRLSDNQVIFTISVAPTAAAGNRSVTIWIPGTGAGVLSGAAAEFTLNVT